MNVATFKTLELVDKDQLRGKILSMPGGDGDPYYLVEIIEEYTKYIKKTNVGCQVIVPRDMVFKYNNKQEGKITIQEVIFETCDVIAQYKDRDDNQVFDIDHCNYSDQPYDPNKEGDGPIESSEN